MLKKPLLAVVMFQALLMTGAAHAQQHMPPRVPISSAERLEVATELGKLMRANYVFSDVADQVSAEILAKAERDGYAVNGMAADYAGTLSYELSHLGKDRHLHVIFDPDFKPQSDTDSGISPEELAKQRNEAEREGYGIAQVERLPGNIGYLDLRSFESAEFVGNAYSSALSLLAGTDGLIIDLRRNSGGDPESVALLMSYFFKPGADQRHLNDLYFRTKNETQQFWTSSAIHERYTNPVYVLTSARTFSGGEECAYDFQTQKRATLIGETTAGGANPGGFFPLGHGFVAFIPTGRAINPVTHTNWEGVGVKPDVAAPAAKAMQLAYADILKSLIAKTSGAEQRNDLQDILTRVEKGQPEQPDYAPPPGR